MCGIVGIYGNLEEIKNMNKRIKNMNDSLFHRGPDAGKEIIEKKIALGQRRLGIIDVTSGANQPMYSENEEWIIVFNGEIYNYKKIKEELNYKFKTESDTEVIVAALQEKGMNWFLKKANGMFAIAAYNLKKDELYLVRDRLGIKPLYYSKVNGILLFSSEIKGILNGGLIKPEFNEEAIDEYLGNRYVRAPFTFFKNIFQLKPATYLLITKENIQENEYWDLPKKFNRQKKYDENEIAEKLEEKLEEAVNKRLLSEVPVGTYLSGGVDSSIITALVSLNKKEQINTYTIGFEEFNEFNYAKMIVDKYNCRHHEMIVSQSKYIKTWDEMIWYKDSPLGVPNEILLGMLSEEIKQDITVILSGEGADELLGGYGKIFRSYYDFKNLRLNNYYDFFIKKYEYVSREIRDRFLTTSCQLRNHFDKEITEKYFKNSSDECVFRFFHKYHVQGLLQRVDSSTMKNGIEARVPFLDHELIEYSYEEIPYELKLKWLNEEAKLKATNLSAEEYSEKLDIPKYLLKKIAYKFLPKENIEREKIGFPVPLNSWFGDLKKIAENELKNSNWLNSNEVDKLYLELEKDKRAGQLLWMFINIEKFRKKYFENKEWRY